MIMNSILLWYVYTWNPFIVAIALEADSGSSQDTKPGEKKEIKNK